jgi:exodeoxyribonuclease V alpha subunit
MRGGMARWKRGVASQGINQALDYAFGGTCDSHLAVSAGAEAAAGYAGQRMHRFIVEDGNVFVDALSRDQLRAWISGDDPESGEHRGRELPSPEADLLLDATINAPKSFSLVALLEPDLGAEFEALQDRLRDRIITTWQAELNARRGAGGAVRQELSRIEVVELKHERSRALDPHKHRHLWLNMKVRGVDGRWSNLDSRVALKFQTVVNAEGDLAARTDPQWVTALAAKGFTLDATGEIEQLAHLVRPLSRRSNQIEANRTARVAEWRAAHPGQEPDHVVLTAIDRWAWASGRPNKPGTVDEDSWAQLVRDELSALDPDVLAGRAAAAVRVVAIGDLDRELLAAQAIVDADRRSAGSGGRFSHYDIRAGAGRVVAASGVVLERHLLVEVLEDVVARAVASGTVDVLEDQKLLPGHVKHFMAMMTAAVKVQLAAELDLLIHPGTPALAETIRALAGRILDEGRTLDAGQTAAAAAIAGTDRLVTVTGPAGTGKTTLLKVAAASLKTQGRRLLVVAPTKKAALVVGRETGASASSLHALLYDHGWRNTVDAAGAQQWLQLHIGQARSQGGPVFTGPTRFVLGVGDRVVVDEAGMVDLHTMRALAIVARQTGAGIAMVGDHLQAAPVGHSGAMAIATQRSTAVVELTVIHRFKDPDYGALSLRLRDPATEADAVGVARELYDHGQVHVVANDAQARARMVQEYFAAVGRGRSVALVTGTNTEAQLVNEAIQAERVTRGLLDSTRGVEGQDGQRLLVGDVVQTRRNDTTAGVENRAVWVVHKVQADSVVLANQTQPGDFRTVTAEYVARHVHLAYASTVHGIQGETTDVSIVGPGVDAAGLYVGMTRGRRHNEAVVVAGGRTQAIDLVAGSMRRGRIETTLADARTAARSDLARSARPDPDARSAVEPAASMEPVAKQEPATSPRPAVADPPRGEILRQRSQLFTRLEKLSDQLSEDRRTLREVEVRIATRDTLNHRAQVSGGVMTPVDDLEAVLATLTIRSETISSERLRLAGEYRKLSNLLEDHAALRVPAAAGVQRPGPEPAGATSSADQLDAGSSL